MSLKGNKSLNEELSSIKLLPQDELERLFIELNNSEDENIKKEIINTIAYHNLRLVRNFIAKNYNQVRISGYEYEELISIGYIGLINAIQRFDYKKGITFSTYATYYLKKEFYENQFTSKGVIHVKRASIERIKKVKKYINNYYIKTGRYPNYEEITKATNISERGLKLLILYNRLIYPFSMENVLKNDKIGPNFDLKVEEIITYEKRSFEDDVVFDMDRKECKGSDFHSLINNSNLTEREKLVIELTVLSNLNFSEIEKLIGYSRETVRRNYYSAIRKLKKNKEIIDIKKNGI